MQIAKSAVCQTFTASRRDNGRLSWRRLNYTARWKPEGNRSHLPKLLRKKWFTAKLLAVLLICMRVLYIWQAFNKI